MSRRFTLDEYLEIFGDDKTQPGEDEIMLHISDAQARTVGLFFIECMGGILLSLGRECKMPQSRRTRREQGDDVTDEVVTDNEDFIN
jgi:hypothetical protein